MGIIPLLAVEVLESSQLEGLPASGGAWTGSSPTADRIARTSATLECRCTQEHRLLAIPSRERLVRVLERLFDEAEFLSPFGIRSLSRVHDRDHPYVLIETEGVR